MYNHMMHSAADYPFYYTMSTHAKWRLAQANYRLTHSVKKVPYGLSAGYQPYRSYGAFEVLLFPTSGSQSRTILSPRGTNWGTDMADQQCADEPVGKDGRAIDLPDAAASCAADGDESTGIDPEVVNSAWSLLQKEKSEKTIGDQGVHDPDLDIPANQVDATLAAINAPEGSTQSPPEPNSAVVDVEAHGMSVGLFLAHGIGADNSVEQATGSGQAQAKAVAVVTHDVDLSDDNESFHSVQSEAGQSAEYDPGQDSDPGIAEISSADEAVIDALEAEREEQLEVEEALAALGSDSEGGSVASFRTARSLAASSSAVRPTAAATVPEPAAAPKEKVRGKRGCRAGVKKQKKKYVAAEREALREQLRDQIAQRRA